MFALANTLAAAGFVPARINLEAAMLDACRAAGASAWYVPDDFLTLGPELVGVSSASVAGTSGYFYTDFSPVVGKSYQITYQYSVTSGTSVQMSLGGSNVPSSTVGSGSVVYTITAANNNPLRCYSNAATAALSGISVKEVVSAKDFQDSVGTLPTYLGGTVGMMFDAAGVTGPGLIANPHTSANWVAEGATPPTAVNGADSYLGKSCRSVTFPVIASGGYAVCRARDAENIFNVVTGTNYVASMEYALSRDLTAGESISIPITGSSGVYAKNLASGTPGGVWMSASGGQPAVASGGGTGLRPFAVTLNSPLTVYVRAVSVKVAGGYVATQATAGNRPLVSRIPRKLGPELATGVVITGTNGTNTGSSTANSFAINQVDATSVVNASISLSKSTTPGASYLLSSTPSSLSGNGFKVDSSSWTPSGAPVTANTVLMATNVPTSQIQVYRAAPPAAGTFSNVSVREVLEWSYALTFDGSNDSLSAPASIIGTNLSQPYTMIAWGKVGALGASRSLIGDAARFLRVYQDGSIGAAHGGVGEVRTGAGAVSAGQLAIIEATYDGGSSARAYLQGAPVASNNVLTGPTTSAVATCLGQRGNSTEFFDGALIGAVVCPAVMTEAQRLAVRRFAAAQMGMTL